MQESSEVLSSQVWVLGGLVSAMFALLIIVFKVGISRINELIKEVHKLNIYAADQKAQLKSLHEKDLSNNRRLTVHSERIRDLELKFANGNF